jgi:hypothetical protein
LINHLAHHIITIKMCATTASLAGRQLDPAEALAGKASIDAEAVRLRNAGLPGTLAQIRTMILIDRIHQRSPWERLAPDPEPEPDDDRGYGGCDTCRGDCDSTCGDGSDPAAGPGAGQSADQETDADQSQPASPDTESGLPNDPYHDDPYHDDPYGDGQFPDAGGDDDEEEG